jgi:hypothetical protein
MKKALAVSIVLTALVAIGCQPTDTKTSADGAAVSGSFKKPPAPEAQVPVNLQNDAYHYYGLNRSEPSNFTLSIDKGVPQAGTETVTFKGVVDGKAKFDITRTGALEQMGSEHVSLAENGITVESTTPGKLEGNPMAMPSPLTAGATWKTDYKVTLEDPTTRVTEDHSTFKVVGPQQVTTKAGIFDAMLVQSEGDDKLDNKAFRLKTQTWYVKDRGPVKIVVTTTVDGKSTQLVIEAAPGDTNKA